MLKQVTLTLDTSDALQAQWLVEYLASPDRARFARACLLLGFLAATGQTPVAKGPGAGPAAGDVPGAPGEQPPRTATAPRRGSGVGAGLFGLD